MVAGASMRLAWPQLAEVAHLPIGHLDAESAAGAPGGVGVN